MTFAPSFLPRDDGGGGGVSGDGNGGGGDGRDPNRPWSNPFVSRRPRWPPGPHREPSDPCEDPDDDDFDPEDDRVYRRRNE